MPIAYLLSYGSVWQTSVLHHFCQTKLHSWPPLATPVTNGQWFPVYRNGGLLSQWDKDLFVVSLLFLICCLMSLNLKMLLWCCRDNICLLISARRLSQKQHSSGCEVSVSITSQELWCPCVIYAPSNITLCGRVSTYEFCWDTNIPSIILGNIREGFSAWFVFLGTVAHAGNRRVIPEDQLPGLLKSVCQWVSWH